MFLFALASVFAQQCAPGRYAVAAGSCADCAPGQYSHLPGQNECTPCEAGRYSNVNATGGVSWTETATIYSNVIGNNPWSVDTELGSNVAMTADGTLMAVYASIDRHVVVMQRDGNSWQKVGDFGTSFNTVISARMMDMSDDGNVIVVGTMFSDSGFSNKGVMQTWRRDSVSQAWQQSNTVVSPQSNDGFGLSVAVSGDGQRAVIGAPYADYGASLPETRRGAVRVYDWVEASNQWQQSGLTVWGAVQYADLGMSVDISSDGNVFAAAGNLLYDGVYYGLVIVYEFSGGSWQQRGSHVLLGRYWTTVTMLVSLADSGDALAYGVIDDSGTQVVVLQWDGASWSTKGSPITADANIGEHGIALSEDATVLAHWNGTDHTVRVYEWSNAAWTQFSVLPLDQPVDVPGVGIRGFDLEVSGNGSVIAVSHPRGHDDGDGSVDVYSRSGVRECLACAAGQSSAVGSSACVTCAAGRQVSGSACADCAAGTYGDGGSACQSCPPGKYSGATQSSSCVSCAAGWHQPASGATSCVACVAGRTSPEVGAADCDPCAAGQYALVGYAACLDCPQGHYASQPATATCSPCQPGEHAPAGSAQCLGQACVLYDTGVYWDGGASATPVTCKVCPSGKHQGVTGAACAGQACAAGRYGPLARKSAALAQCHDCPVGKFTNATGQGACDDSTLATCTAGRYGALGQASAAAAECSDCPSGKHAASPASQACDTCADGQSSAAAQPCEPCEAGRASVGGDPCTACSAWSTSGIGASQCSNCPSGTDANAERVACVPCTPGTHRSSSSDEAACAGTPCAPGTYWPGPVDAAHVCLDCPSGKFQAQQGQASCDGTACPSDTYGTTGSSVLLPCQSCPGGKYQDAEGQAECKASNCTAGYFTNAENTCTPCASGRWNDGTATQCTNGTACAAGQYGPLGSTSAAEATCLPCEAGRHQSSTGAGACVGDACGPGRYGAEGQADAQSAACSDCSAGQYSTSVAATACTPCEAGTYGASTTQCVPCGPGQTSDAGAAACAGSPCAPGTRGFDGINGTCVPCGTCEQQPLAGQTQCDPCPSGRFASSPGTATCGLGACSAGQYSPGDCHSASHADVANCLPCGVGQYQPTPHSFGCLQCPDGKYQNVAGSTGCKTRQNCAAGAYWDGQACQVCPSGTWSDDAHAGEDACQGTPCAAGRHGPTGRTQEASAICTDCDAASYQPEVGQDFCQVCSAGKYRSSSTPATSVESVACVPCEVGRHQPQQGSLACLLCEPGRYRDALVDAASPLACSPCPTNTFNDVAGETQCKPVSTCVEGTYISAAHTAESDVQCTACADGYYQDLSNRQECFPCSEGKYRNSAPASGNMQQACTTCPSHQFQPQPAQMQCLSCPEGQVRDSANGPETDVLIACTPVCAAGEYRSSGICVQCPPGKYQNQNGDIPSCQSCLQGQYAGNYGSATCASCPMGHYADTLETTACKPCPAGKKAKSGLQSLVSVAEACADCVAGTFRTESMSVARCCTCDGLACPGVTIVYGDASDGSQCPVPTPAPVPPPVPSSGSSTTAIMGMVIGSIGGVGALVGIAKTVGFIGKP